MLFNLLSHNFHLTFFFLFKFPLFCVCLFSLAEMVLEARIPPMKSQKLLKSGGQMKRSAAALSASTPPNGLILFAYSAAAHAAYYFWIKCGIHSPAMHSFDTLLWNLSCLMRLKEPNIGSGGRKKKWEYAAETSAIGPWTAGWPDWLTGLTVTWFYISNSSVRCWWPQIRESHDVRDMYLCGEIYLRWYCIVKVETCTAVASSPKMYWGKS